MNIAINDSGDDAAFRYCRMLHEELLEYSFLYVSPDGWQPPLSKLENCLRTLAQRDSQYANAYCHLQDLCGEKPLSWDVLHRSKSLMSILDELRQIRDRRRGLTKQ